ncbi:hypothetical protein MN1_690 [Thermus phage MN1]|nr:hypothetical protein MN1_690 [Thermus phage MN1]
MEKTATVLVWAFAAALEEEWAKHWYPGMPKPEDAPEGTDALWGQNHSAIWTEEGKRAIERWTRHKEPLAKAPYPRTVAGDFWRSQVRKDAWPILGVNLDWQEGEVLEVYVGRREATASVLVRTVGARLLVRGAPNRPPYMSVEGYLDPQAEQALAALLYRALTNVAPLLEEGEVIEATYVLTSMWMISGGAR